MKFKEFYTKLDLYKYYVFTFDEVLAFFPDESRTNLKKILYRFRQAGWIASLKRGFYELRFPKKFDISDLHIANKLYAPSYVSLETALSYYSIIPEVAIAVTSITTKPTRTFRNDHGLFNYRTIKPENYIGYYVTKQGDFDVLMAEPEKALVDFIYFQNFRRRKNYADNDRFDKDIIAKLKKRKIKDYAQMCGLDLKKFYANL